MEHLERLSKILRYAGLNLTPQIINLLLDSNVRNLVDTLDKRLTDNPKLDFDDVDEIVNAINEAAVAQAEAEKAAAEKAKGKKTKLAKA